MHRLRNLIIAIVLTMSSVCAITAALGYYLIATPAGGKILVHYGILWSAEYASVTVESYEGNIAQGLVLKNVEVKNCPFFGPGAAILLQRVDVGFPLLNWRKVWVNVFNGRLNLYNSDPIVFNGSYAGGNIQGSAYSRSADVAVIMRPFLPADVLRPLQGIVSDVDVKFQGTLHDIATSGYFSVDRIEYGETAVRKGFARFSLEFKEEKKQWTMEGPLTLENGVVNIHQRPVDLQQSRAMFTGNVLNPALSIHGTAQVDEYAIDLTINGTLVRPLVHIHSDPYLPEDMAYMMLGLGNWEPSSTKLPYDTDTNRMGLRKKITNDMNIGFSVEQARRMEIGQQQSSYYSKMIEGELAITDNFSFNFSEEIFPRNSNGESRDPTAQSEGSNKGESMLYLQYKNKF